MSECCVSCSVVGDDVIGDQETANVGVSSFRNADNRPLLFAEARLVTAHEIGKTSSSSSSSPPLSYLTQNNATLPK
jgi:hypothetical protein